MVKSPAQVLRALQRRVDRLHRDIDTQVSTLVAYDTRVTFHQMEIRYLERRKAAWPYAELRVCRMDDITVPFQELPLLKQLFILEELQKLKKSNA